MILHPVISCSGNVVNEKKYNNKSGRYAMIQHLKTISGGDKGQFTRTFVGETPGHVVWDMGGVATLR